MHISPTSFFGFFLAQSKKRLEKIFELKEEEQKQVEQEPTKTLYLKFDMNDYKLYDKVKLILSLYQGNCPVIARNTADNKPYKINKTISPNNLLVSNSLFFKFREKCMCSICSTTLIKNDEAFII